MIDSTYENLKFKNEIIWINEMSLWMLNYDVWEDIIGKLIFYEYLLIDIHIDSVYDERWYYELKCVFDLVNNINEKIMIRK